MRIYRNYVKRLLDVFFAAVSLIFLSPVLFVTALLVRVKLGSPVLFRQPRPGRGEKIFLLYKFRSMTDKTGEDGRLLSDAERLTAFGKFLRKSSLDELPELFNILKGDMSIVGPRPLSIYYLPHYPERFRRRHDVRPGLTGLAQVNGRNRLPWDDRLMLDVRYVDELGFLMDAGIVVDTVFKVLRRVDVSVRGTTKVSDYGPYRILQVEGDGGRQLDGMTYSEIGSYFWLEDGEGERYSESGRDSENGKDIEGGRDSENGKDVEGGRDSKSGKDIENGRDSESGKDIESGRDSESGKDIESGRNDEKVRHSRGYECSFGYGYHYSNNAELFEWLPEAEDSCFTFSGRNAIDLVLQDILNSANDEGLSNVTNDVHDAAYSNGVDDEGHLNDVNDVGHSNNAYDVGRSNDANEMNHSSGANDIDFSDGRNKSANKRTNIQDGLNGRNVVNGLQGDGLRGSRLQGDGLRGFHRRRINRVYVPSYCCVSMLQAFVDRGMRIEFYDIGFEDGKFTFRIPGADSRSAVLIMSYFGLDTEAEREAVRKSHEMGAVVIEDVSHSLLRGDAAAPESDYVVASLRKWFPIPAGGWAGKRNGMFSEKPVLDGNDAVREKIKAMREKYDYLLGRVSSKENFLLASAKFENDLIHVDRRLKIDDASMGILQNLGRLEGEGRKGQVEAPGMAEGTHEISETAGMFEMAGISQKAGISEKVGISEASEESKVAGISEMSGMYKRTGISEMSGMGSGIDNVVRKRRRNADALLEGLRVLDGSFLSLPRVDLSVDVPLFLPVFLENGRRDFLRDYLVKRGFYCPVHWPEVMGAPAGVRKNELSLICDQRYTEGDMRAIVEAIVEAAREWEEAALPG